MDVAISETDTLILDFRNFYCLSISFASRQPKLHALLVNYQLLNSTFLPGAAGAPTTERKRCWALGEGLWLPRGRCIRTQKTHRQGNGPTSVGTHDPSAKDLALCFAWRIPNTRDTVPVLKELSLAGKDPRVATKFVADLLRV